MDFYTIVNNIRKSLPAFFLSIGFVVIGILVVFVGIEQQKTFNEELETFIEIQGFVDHYEYSNNGNRAIVAEYVVDGQTYVQSSDFYTSWAKPIGSSVAIKYNPDNPHDAFIVASETGSIILMFVVGGGFFAAGIFIFYQFVLKKE